MKKKLMFLFSILIIASMVLSACSTPTAAPTAAAKPTDAPKAEVKPTEAPKAEVKPTEAPAAAPTAAPAADKTVLKVWSFTNEIKTMAIAFEGLHPEVDVQYTMIPMTNGEYQTKVKAALKTDDAPDVIALEASFVKSYVESDFLADLGSLLPAAEAAKIYPFVIDVGTADGVTKAFSYQATPGALFYRRSLAKEYFGTDDPAKIQELLSDMDKFTAAAAVVKEKSGGKTFMVASNGDFQNLFFANREQPWIVDDTLVVDPMVVKYVEIAKTFRDNGYEARANQWGEGWFAGMNDSLVDASGTSQKIFSYFLPTWGLPYVLAPNAKSKDGSKDTTGDWAVITGPLPYQWGGTWLGVMKDSKQMDLAKEFVRFCTIDETNLKNWATGVYTNEYLKKIDPTTPDDQKQAAGDFVSSQNVVSAIVSTFDNSDLSKFLGGQNSYGGFAAAAPSVNAKLMTGADDAIQRALNDPIAQYLDGKITIDEMWANWKASVRNEFPDITVP
ncbi:MAG TPA: ABC transporter substrate-binding protein [Anaerolineaceae bacterium]|nr:ABC transporter substrate-binding protein [Anaerolineaceae bacterium]HPN53050.1 ABC transporter substrate-binding protein [Anaerolineaceae bacterium]